MCAISNRGISKGPFANITLNGGPGFTQYRWSNGSYSSSISVKHHGLYVLEALSPQGCVSRDSVSISVVDTATNFLKPTYSFCVADPKIIAVEGAFERYVWSTSDTGSVLAVKNEGSYTLEVTNADGCTGSSSTVVEFESCYKGMVYPNAFTPNNDGINDTYKPVTGLLLQHYEFTIYNRWGQVVFHTTDIKQAWNGRVNGREAVSDTYTWKCVYMDDGKTMHVDKGIVVLVR